MNCAFVIMAELSAMLACSLAAWMSLLFCRASSMACFRVRETAEVLVDGASCARTVKAAEKSNGTSRTSKKELAFELVKPVLVMRAPFCSFSLKTGGPSKLPSNLGVHRVNNPPHRKFTRNGGIQLVASARPRSRANSRKRGRWNRKPRMQSGRSDRRSEREDFPGGAAERRREWQRRSEYPGPRRLR